jgi:hypothetical protein
VANAVNPLISAPFAPRLVAGEMSIMGIKVIKAKKATDFTFLDDGMTLPALDTSKSESKKDKTEPVFRLRESSRVRRLKKSRISGGHGMQDHSPVYE